MSFCQIFPTSDPALAALARAALVAEDDARSALVEASSGAVVPPGELIAWTWTFDRSFSSTLLVDHQRFDALMPPGGRVEVGEHPRAAALRELHEETGIAGLLVDERPALVDVVRGTTADGAAFQTFGLAFAVIADPGVPLDGEPGQQPLWVPVRVRPERAHERHWQRMMAYLASR